MPIAAAMLVYKCDIRKQSHGAVLLMWHSLPANSDISRSVNDRRCDHLVFKDNATSATYALGAATMSVRELTIWPSILLW